MIIKMRNKSQGLLSVFHFTKSQIIFHDYVNGYMGEDDGSEENLIIYIREDFLKWVKNYVADVS